MKKTLILAGGLAATLLFGCADRAPQDKTENDDSIEYAKYFSIAGTGPTDKTITITDLWSGKEHKQTYRLIPRKSYAGYKADPYAVPYPIERCICMSTSHVAYLNSLSLTETIKGISGTRFVYGKAARALIDKERIKDIGTESLPNYELIMSLEPDIVFAYGISGSDNSYINKLRELGIKVMVVGDYLENHPLGRMEYIRLFGELAGKRAEADSIFDFAKQEYISLKNRIMKECGQDSGVRVLINSPFNGIWYIPGEDNYMSLLVKDAGGTILGSRSGETGSGRMSIEKAYMNALEADIWLNPGDFTLESLANINPLFANIPALKNGMVYNNSRRHTPAGGSDFWETGAVEPHIVLKDLAMIFHPELRTAEDTLKYHYKLR